MPRLRMLIPNSCLKPLVIIGVISEGRFWQIAFNMDSSPIFPSPKKPVNSILLIFFRHCEPLKEAWQSSIFLNFVFIVVSSCCNLSYKLYQKPKTITTLALAINKSTDVAESISPFHSM